MTTTATEAAEQRGVPVSFRCPVELAEAADQLRRQLRPAVDGAAVGAGVVGDLAEPGEPALADLGAELDLLAGELALEGAEVDGEADSGQPLRALPRVPSAARARRIDLGRLGRLAHAVLGPVRERAGPGLDRLHTFGVERGE